VSATVYWIRRPESAEEVGRAVEVTQEWEGFCSRPRAGKRPSEDGRYVTVPAAGWARKGRERVPLEDRDKRDGSAR
jgi:hypothetical protein